MIATCRSHAIRFYLSEPCTLVAKADLKTRLRASKLVCGDRDEHPHDPPAFGTAWFHDLAAFTEAVKIVVNLGKAHDETVIRAEGHLGGDVPKCCRDCGAAVIGNLKSWLDGHRLACPSGRLPAWAKRKADRKQQRSKLQTAPHGPYKYLPGLSGLPLLSVP